VPSLADFAFIHLAEGDHLQCAGCAHATRDGQRAVSELARIHVILRTDSASTVAQVVRSGRSQLRNEMSIDPDPRLSPRVAAAHRQLAPRSAVVVPLLSGGEVLGALTLGSADSGRRYTTRDVTVAERLARVITAALSPTDPASSNPGLMARPATGRIRRLPPLRARV
jgi:GAF domain-containing protein